MWRSRFDEITASIHLVDNMNITADSFYKVHPLFEKLAKVNTTVSIQAHLDEIDVCGWDDDWVLQTAWTQAVYSGKASLHMLEVTQLFESGLGQGPCVLLGLAENVRVLPGCKFYHKSFFTTLSLVDEVTRGGFGSCSTLLENKLFTTYTSICSDMKMSRGEAEYLAEVRRLMDVR